MAMVLVQEQVYERKSKADCWVPSASGTKTFEVIQIVCVTLQNVNACMIIYPEIERTLLVGLHCVPMKR